MIDPNAGIAPTMAGAMPAFAPDSPAIRAVDLAKTYRSTTALAGLTMTVPRGEVFGFLGPNGAGKTTAVKLLVGLIRPTSGEAWVLGEPLGNREIRRRIGYLPELFRYQDWMTAREVLRLHCRLAGLPTETHESEIHAALDTVGLAHRGQDRVGTFSKGMQQRLGLGVALLGSPDLVFLDEPTSALDPVGRHDVREIIRSMKTRGSTIFLNSHLLSEVEQVCDRVAVVDRGNVIAIGTMDELRGAELGVRLHLGLVSHDGRAVLERYGRVEADLQPQGGVENRSYLVHGVRPDEVPDLVVELVRCGTRIHAVEPTRHSLEDRFLELLGEAERDDPDDRPIDPA